MRTPWNGITLAERLLDLFRAQGWTLATAESCTGGVVGHWITEIAGSSDYYVGGAIAYSNDAKCRLLGVDPLLIQQYGAVSKEVALAMARGVRNALGATVGLSITGIVGPGGGTPQKPVGTVYIGLSSPWREWVEHHIWPYDRSANKKASAYRALEMALALGQAENAERNIKPPNGEA